MSDDWFLSRYRQMKIVLGSADWDICLDANIKFSGMLHGKADSALARRVERQFESMTGRYG